LGVSLAACGGGSVQTAGHPTTTTTSASTTTATAGPNSTVTAPITVAGQATTVVADCGAGAYQPARIIIACGDGNVIATQIRWTQWVNAQAVGTSEVLMNPCKPSCASSPATPPHAAKLTLSDPVATAHGPRFSKVTIAWTGPSPTGTPTINYPLTTTTP
jgi:hypothetical protein